MTPEAALYNHLTAAGVLTALGGRVYPNTAPQGGVKPCCVFHLISCVPVEGMQGSSGLEERRYQFDLWGPVSDDVKAIGDALRLRFQGFQGVMGTVGPTAGVPVSAVHHAGMFDDFNDDLQLYRRSLDFLIWFEVARPS